MKIKEKENQKSKVNLFIFTAVLILTLILILILSLKNESKPLFKDQKVEGLDFKNANLVYKNGINIFSAELSNNNSKKYELKSIIIIFKDENDKEIKEIEMNVGNFINKKTTLNLHAEINNNLKNVSKVSYKIKK